MASTFKAFTSTDIINTKTLLHEAIPLTGTIVSGTYSENNIKNYSHGMFQSVYDYPYLSSSANHIFDITVGYANSSALSASAATQNSKKINIYNQMAQVLMGNDVTGNVQLFDEDGDLTGGTKIKEAYFMNFSRLLVKDEIKKGTFELKLGVGNTDAVTPSNQWRGSGVNDSRIKITDTNAANDYRVNASAGEYGILYATGSSGSELLETDDATEKCGLIFYQAGVVVLSGSVFKRKNQGGLLSNTTYASASATAAFTMTDGDLATSGQFTEGEYVILTSTDGTKRVYVLCDGSETMSVTTGDVITESTDIGASTLGSTVGDLGTCIGVVNNLNTHSQALVLNEIKAAIVHANGHLGKITAGSDVSVADGNVSITFTQSDAGPGGNTVTTTNISQLTAADFTGGKSEPLVHASGSYKGDDAFYSGSISGSADGFRARIVNVSFNNTTELNSAIHFCRINHNDFNYSSNPTYLSDSKIRVKRQSTDSPVSYITTIGLYSADNELLAVGKLSEPLKNDPTQDMTLRVRLDY